MGKPRAAQAALGVRLRQNRGVMERAGLRDRALLEMSCSLGVGEPMVCVWQPQLQRAGMAGGLPEAAV